MAFNEVPCKAVALRGPEGASLVPHFRAQDVEALDCGHEFFNQIYQSLGLGLGGDSGRGIKD